MMRAKNKAIVSLAMALFLCAAMLTPALADTTWAVVYGTASLNVRATPSTAGVWRGAAARGEWVEILYPSGNNWYYCRVASTNVTGYMSGSYLKTAQDALAPVPASGTGVIYNPDPSGYVNMRNQPGYQGQVIHILYNSDTVQILGSQNGWYNVYADWMMGYVLGAFVTTGSSPVQTKTAVVQTGNAGKLNMRTAPLSTSAIRASYANGTQVTVLLEGKEFDMVSVGGVTGFMAVKFLKVGGAGGGTYPAPAPIPVSGGYAVVKNDNALATLNLRMTPSTSAKVLAQLKNGTQLNVIEPGETWCKVSLSSGTVGYVMTKYLQLHNLATSPKKTVQNGSSYVNLRSKGSYNASVLLRVYSGNEVTVLIPGDVWTKVRYETYEGYLMTYFLK